MKGRLLAATALATLLMVVLAGAQPARAADSIHLSLEGFYDVFVVARHQDQVNGSTEITF
jgi:hypothetical protein